MSTTENVSGADLGAGQGDNAATETKLPELQTAGDAHQQTDAAESTDQSNGEAEGDKLTPEQRTIRKLERRIERLTAKRGGSERENEILRQELEATRRQLSTASDQESEGRQGETGKRPIAEAEIEDMARKRAEQIVHQRTIGERVSEVLKEGKKLEGFNQAVDALAEVVPFTDRQGRPTPFIEAVLDSDMKATLLKYLGDNPDEAEDLADMTPVQLGRRIAKLEDKLKQGAKKQTSDAPKPLQGVKTGSTSVSVARNPEDLMNELRSMRAR